MQELSFVKSLAINSISIWLNFNCNWHKITASKKFKRCVFFRCLPFISWWFIKTLRKFFASFLFSLRNNVSNVLNQHSMAHKSNCMCACWFFSLSVWCSSTGATKRKSVSALKLQLSLKSQLWLNQFVVRMLFFVHYIRQAQLFTNRHFWSCFFRCINTTFVLLLLFEDKWLFAVQTLQCTLLCTVYCCWPALLFNIVMHFVRFFVIMFRKSIKLSVAGACVIAMQKGPDCKKTKAHYYKRFYAN